MTALYDQEFIKEIFEIAGPLAERFEPFKRNGAWSFGSTGGSSKLPSQTNWTK
jgi:hypothetical protein